MDQIRVKFRVLQNKIIKELYYGASQSTIDVVLRKAP
jgi:hypothetical protein